MEKRRVLVVGYHAAELLDIACVTSALEMANFMHGSAVYEVSLASPARGFAPGIAARVRPIT